jgi:hypothetical protein
MPPDRSGLSRVFLMLDSNLITSYASGNSVVFGGAVCHNE